jgi:serine/threonine-protein kinase
VRAAAWEELSRLFEQAAELTGASRSAFLDETCGDDDGLRCKLEQMLAADALDDDFIAPPARAATVLSGGEPAAPDHALLGREVGPWRLERLLGSGGMGDVFLARRVDRTFEKSVALKALKRGLDTDELLRRFDHERRALAALEHPGIARLLDAGALQDGRPYLVMEHVDGVPIDRYCDEHELDTTARIRLFLEVCRALTHAHGHLVLHCDLKPANILVTPDGHPKLLDFGVAKLLDDGTDALTRTGAQRPMTLEYVSPEALHGQPLSTASDVYSLGVVLYELLAGCSPYRYDTRHELRRAITETEPVRPSTARREPGADDARGLRRRRLSGDLDTIVLMALRKEPERRYATVDQLAEDLLRHLGGLPVRARPATWSYVAGKFVTRHRWGLLGAAAVLLSLAAGVVGVSWRAEELGRERDRALSAQAQALSAQAEAESAQAQAESVTGFLEDVLASPGPDQLGREGSLLDVLEHASKEVERRFGDQPLVEASVRTVLGRTWLTLGRLDEAAPQLERALALREEQLPAGHPLLADSLDDLGQLRFAQREPRQALPLLERALDGWRASAGARSVQAAQALNDIGATLNALGESARAEQLLGEALDIRQELLGPDDPALAETLTNLALCYRARGASPENERAVREALRIRRAAFGSQHRLVAQSLSNLAVSCMYDGRYEEAAGLLDEGLEVLRELLGDEHPEVATALVNLGSLHQIRGDYDAAARALGEAASIRRGLFPPGHLSVVSTEVRQGIALVLLGRLAEAEPLLVPGAERYAATLPAGDRQAQNILESVARMYEGSGRPERAREVRERMAAGG